METIRIAMYDCRYIEANIADSISKVGNAVYCGEGYYSSKKTYDVYCLLDNSYISLEV